MMALPMAGRSLFSGIPPIIDEAKSVRRSANSEATNLFTELVSSNIRSLTFARTRRLTELIYNYTRRGWLKSAPPSPRKSSLTGLAICLRNGAR